MDEPDTAAIRAGYDFPGAALNPDIANVLALCDALDRFRAAAQPAAAELCPRCTAVRAEIERVEAAGNWAVTTRRLVQILDTPAPIAAEPSYTETQIRAAFRDDPASRLAADTLIAALRATPVEPTPAVEDLHPPHDFEPSENGLFCVAPIPRGLRCLLLPEHVIHTPAGEAPAAAACEYGCIPHYRGCSCGRCVCICDPAAPVEPTPAAEVWVGELNEWQPIADPAAGEAPAVEERDGSFCRDCADYPPSCENCPAWHAAGETPVEPPPRGSTVQVVTDELDTSVPSTLATLRPPAAPEPEAAEVCVMSGHKGCYLVDELDGERIVHQRPSARQVEEGEAADG